MSKETERFYWTKAWKHTRRAYMALEVEIDGRICPSNMCEECFKKGLLVPAEMVHHKVWVTKHNMHDPSVTLNFDNLERVCRKCHEAIHSESAFIPRVGFTPDGKVFKIG